MTFDTDYTHNAICPYCGHEQSDSWEINLGPGMEGDGEMLCGECEQNFIVSRHCEITYSTEKIKP